MAANGVRGGFQHGGAETEVIFCMATHEEMSRMGHPYLPISPPFLNHFSPFLRIVAHTQDCEQFHINLPVQRVCGKQSSESITVMTCCFPSKVEGWAFMHHLYHQKQDTKHARNTLSCHIEIQIDEWSEMESINEQLKKEIRRYMNTKYQLSDFPTLLPGRVGRQQL